MRVRRRLDAESTKVQSRRSRSPHHRRRSRRQRTSSPMRWRGSSTATMLDTGELTSTWCRPSPTSTDSTVAGWCTSRSWPTRMRSQVWRSGIGTGVSLPPSAEQSHCRNRPARRVRPPGRLAGHTRGVAQLGRAPALGAGDRRFKSCHPDKQIPSRRPHSLCQDGLRGRRTRRRSVPRVARDRRWHFRLSRGSSRLPISLPRMIRATALPQPPGHRG